MTRVKICGLKTLEDIAVVNCLCPDYVGFVFAESRRRVSIEQVRHMKAALRKEIKSVGVFVNAPLETVLAAAKSGGLDLVQLHGEETAEYIQEVQKEGNIEVIKAIRVQNRKEILEAQNLPCEYLLLDTYLPGQQGGSGKTFDWSLIPRLEKPYFLAGGLNSKNVEQAVQIYHPFAVDVSSAVETNGKKDAKKIQIFIQKVRT